MPRREEKDESLKCGAGGKQVGAKGARATSTSQVIKYICILDNISIPVNGEVRGRRCMFVPYDKTAVVTSIKGL